MSVDGYLGKKGYKVLSLKDDIDRTRAINLAIGDKTLMVDYFGTISLFGYNDPEGKNSFYGYYDEEGNPSSSHISFYFVCSQDYQYVSLNFIYNRGHGIKEMKCDISEDLKLAIIGKCMLFIQDWKKENGK